MQHNRITMLSSSETCHLGSSSSDTSMDQQNLLPNNPTLDEQVLLPDTLETDNYPHYLLNGDDRMANRSLICQQNANLGLWDSAGSSSMDRLVDHGSILQSKRERCASSLSIGGPSITDRRHEVNSSLLSHSLNIDLNVNQADQFATEDVDVVHCNGQSRANAPSFHRASSSTERIRHHGISLDGNGSSTQTSERLDGQAFDVREGYRSSYKRKNFDGNWAETSADGSSRNQCWSNNVLRPSQATCGSTNLTMPTSNYDDLLPPTEHLNQSNNISASVTLTDNYPLYPDPDESERFMRNTRMRISSSEYDQSLPRLLPEESFRRSAYQPAQQQSSSVPVQPRVMNSSASSYSRSHVPAIAQFSQNLLRHPSSGNFGSGIGSSSRSADTAILRSAPQDPSRSLRSHIPEPLLLGSFLHADSTDLLSAPGTRSSQQNSGSSSSSSLRAAVNANASQPSTRGLADVTRTSSLSAGVSHPRSSSIEFQHGGPSSTSLETRNHQPGSSSHAQQQHYFRAGLPSIDRQNSDYLDLQSFMQTIAASREGSRTVSELRNVVDQIRQGRSARLEDLLLIDRSLIVTRANLIDRHREMRLDVDNMSYEELLALGERIGYVNTGLTEEKIMSALKKWKYFCMPLEEPPTNVEPCCICQEDYVEDEEMGRLDCGHDFHTACIKRWLVIKNLCPICKKTALGT